MYVTNGVRNEILGAGLAVDANLSPDGSALLYSVIDKDNESFKVYIVKLGSEVGNPVTIYSTSSPEDVSNKSLRWISHNQSQLAKISISSDEEGDNLNAVWTSGEELIELTGSGLCQAIQDTQLRFAQRILRNCSS